ncbi:hypothetical protein LCGC14_0423470 [marine sediment metagenome]|uniref:Phage protein n=1 Tax=marine sediment metagenome TaxID=412755 RepID=A0A0F9SWA3_9ZZZZ
MKFRKKPIVIEAMQTDGTIPTANAIRAWSNDQVRDHWIGGGRGVAFNVPTLEGTMLASPGDWIIRGIHGEYYPCKPEIFAATYDLVEEE